MKKTSLNRALAALVVLAAAAAVAGPDDFFLGNGRPGQPLVTIATGASVVVNNYAQVTSALAPGDTTVVTGAPVETDPNAAPLADGALVMLIQTTGIVPAATPGAQSAIDLRDGPVGRWELARVVTVTGTTSRTLTLERPLKYSYASGVTQVVVVPEYANLTIPATSTVRARSWDGSTGGIVALLATGTVTNNGTLSAQGAGFRGGEYVQSPKTQGQPYETCPNATYPRATQAPKGEGLNNLDYDTDTAQTAVGRENVANGAGGGICNQAGGGGGGNAGLGGAGGNSSDGNRAVGGHGGAPLGFSPLTHLSLGGGGGSGHGNDSYDGNGGSGPATEKPLGGRGGGIIFIRANALAGSGIINASGMAGVSTSRDGAGGGGAGGTIHIRLQGSQDTSACPVGSGLRAEGGNGGSPTHASVLMGPGGGGGGGWVLFQSGSGAACTISVASGIAGQSLNDFRSATPESSAPPYSGLVTLVSRGIAVPSAPILTAPANDGVTNNPVPTVSGTGTPNTEVVVYPVDANQKIVGAEIARARVLPDGTFSAQLTRPLPGAVTRLAAATEFEGLQGPVSASAITFTLDQQAPEASFTSTLPGESQPGTFSFSFSAQDSSAPCGSCTFECDFEGTGYASCTSPRSTTKNPTVDTSYTVRVRATDKAGNVSLPISHTWKVNPTRPDTNLVSGPGTVNKDARPTFIFNSPASDLLRFECSLVVGPATTPAGTWVTCASPYQLPGPDLVHDTQYTMRIRAVDVVGNPDDSPASRTWTVDRVAPETAFGPTVPDLDSNDAPAVFDLVITDNGGAECPTCLVECSFDGAPFSDCSVDQAQFPRVSFPVATDKQYTLLVRATDEAGNADASPASYTWRVDRAGPDTAIESGPSVWSRDAQARFRFSSPAADVARFECSMVVGTAAPASWATCPAAYLAPDTQVHGTQYTMWARAVDTAGNPDGSPASTTWTVDRNVPDTSIPTGPPALGSSTTADFTFASHDVYVAPPAPRTACANCTLECSLDGAPYAPCQGQYTDISDGQHTLLARAVDEAGNVDQTPASHSWSVITGPVTMQIDSAPPAPPGLTNSRTAAFRFLSNKPGVAYWCKREDEPTFSPCPQDGANPASALYTNVPDGNHWLTVYARDASNSTSQEVTAFWDVDGTPPAAPSVASPIGGALVNDRTPLIEGTSAEGGMLTITIDGVVVGSTGTGAGDWAIESSLSLGNGEHWVSATLRDSAGNSSSESARVTFVVDALAPETELLGSPPVLINTPTLTLEFRANEESSFECSLDSPIFRPCDPVHPVTVTEDGFHTLQVRAVDRAGNPDATPASHTWKVDTQAPRTTIVTAPPLASSSRTAEFVFDSSESGVSYECKLDDEAFAPCDVAQPFDDLSEEPHTLTVRARDEAGNVDSNPPTHVWTVDLTDPPVPVLTGPEAGAVLGTLTPTFQGTAEPDSFVRIFVNGQQTAIGQARVDGSGQWRFTPTDPLAEGVQVAAVVGLDAAGNDSERSAEVGFTIDLSINRPREIDSRGGGLSCSATGTPGSSPWAVLGLLALGLLAARRRSE